MSVPQPCSRSAGFAQGDPAARSFLFDALAKPGIATSAAAALGRISDPAVSAEVGQRLSQARSEDERRLLVLALRLDANPAARAELERFADLGRRLAEAAESRCASGSRT